jgi:UDP-N-acetylmuramate dehydrogenase
MKIYENLSLSDMSYYHIGGNARYVLKIINKEDLLLAITFLREHKIDKYLILGLGSNVILDDRDFSGAVIWLQGEGGGFEKIEDPSSVSSDSKSSGQVRVFSGETMDSLIQFSFKHSLIGLEWAGGLPSTVGGAVRGNAGCFGSEIRDTIIGVEAVDIEDPQLVVRTFSFEEIAFSYRNSFFKDHPNLFIISAIFRLIHADTDNLEKAKEAYLANIAYRQKNHPMEYPSCGSVFKNVIKREEVEKILSVWPEVRELSEGKWHDKIAMGYVINRLGFSGKRIGGAMVSPKHTNYIVNIDHAKAADVKTLISEIQAKFIQIFGFTPEPEVIIL